MWFRYADKVLARDIPAYSTMDLRLGWHPSENLEFSLVGQNLFDSAHLEFIDPSIFSDPAEIERSMYVKMTWRF
jgi:iron complex outermembrane receptor protein